MITARSGALLGRWRRNEQALVGVAPKFIKTLESAESCTT
jgi:hypothetical protein